MMLRITIALFAAAAFVWASDPREILQRLIDDQAARRDRVQPYTYTEEAVHYDYASDGSLRKGMTETREVIFVEGWPYHKLVARNGKALPAKEQAQIEKSIHETAEERRRQPHTPEGGYLAMGGQRIDLGATRELLTMFDNRLRGEEELRGRKAWVVESMPQNGYAAQSEHEREVLSFRRTIWIDEEENCVARMELAVVGDGIHFAARGSTIRLDNSRIAPGVWLPTELVVEIWHPAGKGFKAWKRTEYASSNFQKFDVQSTVTVVGH